MRAYELLKSGFQTWVALYNSIRYKAIGGLFLLNSEIEERRRSGDFVEIRNEGGSSDEDGDEPVWNKGSNV